MIKRFSYLLFFIPIFFASTGKPAIIKVDELVNRYKNTNDTTYIINFWATWCGPCVAELPDFERINEKYKDKKVKVILVSMDFVSDYNSKLIPFINKKKIKSEVVLLNETKPDIFINKINPTWQGSLPATMIINNAKKLNSFTEDQVSFEFLEEKVKSAVN